MACIPFNIGVGPFLTTAPIAWSNAPNTSQGGKTVTRTASGISVTGPTGAMPFHSTVGGRQSKYMFIGSDNYLLILDSDTGVGPVTHSVSLVDFTTTPPTERALFSVLTSSSAVNPPHVQPSPGTGSAFLSFSPTDTVPALNTVSNIAIRRSDNGDVLCSAVPFVPASQLNAESTATDLNIKDGGAIIASCPKPAAHCTITPASQQFPDVFVGGCPFTPPTKQFTIKNTGNDCLTVNPIANSAPFSIQSTSKPLPASLSHNEQVDVTVLFNPTGVGTWNPVNLPVVTAPAVGDDKLVCKGKALTAEFKIGFNNTSFDFGKKPVGTSQSKPLTITNTGSKPMTVSSAGVTADGFSVAPFSNALTCGDSFSIPIQFNPPSEGLHTAVFSVNHSAPGNPTPINLSGRGCIANAEIVVPPTAPIDFGQIQQGFRTVRFFTVSNPGDGPLSFQGVISGADAGLFGLPDPNGSVTSPPASRTYAVNPVDPCGSLTAGTGEIVVAVSFYAGVMPKNASAILTLSGHNATNFPPAQTWVFPLTAEITPPIALDVALVVDRSDSMGQTLGSRIKIDAAVAASQLFVELLRADLDDRVAVVRFNNDRNVVQPMTAVSTVNPPTQDQIRQKVATDIPPHQGLTAIAGGTMMGVHEVQKPHPGNPSPLNKAVVVLTDGIENTAFEEPAGNWLSIMGGTMYTPTAVFVTDVVATNPVGWPAGIDRYAVGLGKTGEVAPDQLEALTGSPDRVFYVNEDMTGAKYFQLEKYYTQIFMSIVGTQPVTDPMYWIAPGQTHEIQFEVLPGDVDAIVVIYDFQGHRLPFFCVSPTGEILDPAIVPPGYQLRSGFTSQARLVEFKMPAKQPNRYAGTWKVLVQHSGVVCTGNPNPQSKERGFLPRECRHGVKDPQLYGIAIGVGSDFRMMPFVTPAPVYVGDPILLTAVVSEAGLPILGANVTVEATAPDGTVWNLKLFDDGAHQDSGSSDGEYANPFSHTSLPGIYHFKFRSIGKSRDGKQVVREALRDKPVLPRGGSGQPVPPGTRDGKPQDGDRPPQPDCCKELVKAIRAQTRLLEDVLKGKGPK